MYDFIFNASNDKALALDAVRMVPLFVVQLASLDRTVRKLDGVDLTKLADMTDDLLDNELSATEKILGLAQGEEVKKKLKYVK